MGPKLAPPLNPKIKENEEIDSTNSINDDSVASTPKKEMCLEENKDETNIANIKTEQIEFSDIASEEDFPKILSELHQKSRPTIITSIFDEEQKQQRHQRYSSPTKSRKKIKGPQTPQPLVNNMNEKDDEESQRQLWSLEIKSFVQVKDSGDQTQEEKEEIDSDIMSERAHLDKIYEAINYSGQPQLLFQKPRIHSLPFKLDSRNQDTIKTKDRALLPQKKNLNFTIQSSPPNEEEETKSKKEPLQSTEYFQIKLEQAQTQKLKSLITWQSEEFITGYEHEMKSIPFSQLIAGQDAESHFQNFFEASQQKSDILQATPKQGFYFTNKSQIKGMNWTQTYKSSIFLDELFQEDEIIEQLSKINILQNNIEASGGLNRYESQMKSNYTQNCNTMYYKYVEDAKQRGLKIQQELLNFQSSEEHQTFNLPEGLSIIERGILTISKERKLQQICGNGTKVLICTGANVLLHNITTKSLTISAIQFELENAFERQENPSVLIQIIEEEEEQDLDINEFQRTKQIIFEDCYFIQDTHQYENAPRNAYLCQTALKIVNKSRNTLLDVTFNNCAFFGFHHAIQVVGKQNININCDNSTFKKQLNQSVFVKDIMNFQMKDCIIKKSSLLNKQKAALQIKFSTNILSQRQSQIDQSVILIENNVFKKNIGTALLISGNQQEFQNFNIKISECQFIENKGESAIRLQNLASICKNRYEIISDFDNSSSKPSTINRIKKEQESIKILNCKIEENGNYGILILNILSSYLLKKSMIKNNQESGLIINEQSDNINQHDEMCSCLSMTNFIHIETLNQTFEKQSSSKKQPLLKKQKIQNTIVDSLITLNQYYGIEVKNLSKTDLTINNCEIENNFSDGIIITSTKQLVCNDQNQKEEQDFNHLKSQNPNIFRQIRGSRDTSFMKSDYSKSMAGVNGNNYQTPSKEEGKNEQLQNSVQKHNFSQIKIHNSKICVNKNNGITIEKLSYLTIVQILKNEFSSNLNNDIQCNDQQSYKNIRIPIPETTNANKMHSAIKKNFDVKDLNLSRDNQNGFSLYNSFSQEIREGEVLKNSQDFKNNKTNKRLRDQSKSQRKAPIQCIGRLCGSLNITHKSSKASTKATNSRPSPNQSQKQNTSIQQLLPDISEFEKGEQKQKQKILQSISQQQSQKCIIF